MAGLMCACLSSQLLPDNCSTAEEYGVALHVFARAGLEDVLRSEDSGFGFMQQNLLDPRTAGVLHSSLVQRTKTYLARVRQKSPPLVLIKVSS